MSFRHLLISVALVATGLAPAAACTRAVYLGSDESGYVTGAVLRGLLVGNRFSKGCL